jgi:hypothetical protein
MAEQAERLRESLATQSEASPRFVCLYPLKHGAYVNIMAHR